MPSDYIRTTEVIGKTLLIMQGKPGTEKSTGGAGWGEEGGREEETQF